MSKRILWHGELTTTRSLRWRGLLWIAAGMAWLLAFLALPALLLVVIAFAQRGDYGEIEWSWTTENFTRLAGFGLWGWEPNILWILGRSVVVAAVTSAVCVALAYPLAFFLASKPRRTRYIWVSVVMIPFCTNLVVRTYAWMLLLSSQLPPARFAQWLGWIPGDAALYPSQFAVYLGMISSLLPFTALPLYTNVERLDWSIVEAARDLYASPWRVFRHGVLPQTSAGLSVALVLTFIPAMGMFVVPRLLGGAKYLLVGDLIQQQFTESRDYPFGAALSLGLVLLTLLGLAVSWRRIKRTEPA